MPAPVAGEQADGYAARLAALVLSPSSKLLRSATHPQAGSLRRALIRQLLLLIAIGAVIVVALMLLVDVAEIGLMPPRGSAGLWPFRVMTDFGKADYVLWALALLWALLALAAPALRGTWQARLARLAMQLQFMFFAVLVPVLAGDVIKWIVGRGRPFVGGPANAFNFSPFAGTEAFASFPSAHAITSAALAFAVAAMWPRARIAVIIYALLIIVSRLVLLAHHPSDVIGGALIGVTGAMAVRYWFAARGVGFGVGSNGAITPPI